MMRLKPSFAQKLNPKGYSPIHLALKNDQAETVLRLVDVDRNLVSLQGRDGLSSLHIAALQGKDKIVARFLVSHPKSIKQLTIRKESALHIAVKYGNIETLKILLEWTKQACTDSILNWSDDEGNNIMHLAALGNQIEMVKLLLKYKVDIKSKNLEGLTTLDILRQNEFLGDRELRVKLNGGQNIILSLLRPAMLLKWTLWFMKRLLITDHRDIQHISKEDRNAILVVSVLIATTTYQALLSPQESAMLTSKYFIMTNTLAFVASMVEICLHLPSSIGYTLQLVLPLVICYILLMVFWSCYTAFVAAMVFFGLFLTKNLVVRQKLRGDLNPRKFIKFGSIIKRNLNMETKFTQISVDL